MTTKLENARNIAENLVDMELLRIRYMEDEQPEGLTLPKEIFMKLYAEVQTEEFDKSELILRRCSKEEADKDCTTCRANKVCSTWELTTKGN